MTKNKNVTLYHPTAVDCETSFADIIGQIGESSQSAWVLSCDSDARARIELKFDKELCIITVCKLKNQELPKIANESDGLDESKLSVPDGKALSFKNIFVYDCRRNILAAARLGSCPWIGMLRECLGQVVANINDGEKVKLRFPVIMKRDLAEVLSRANLITQAEFRADEFYGEDMERDRLGRYKEYIGGQTYTKETKLKARRGENLKNVVAAVLEDVIAHGLPPDGIGVSMTIDGEPIDFSKYCVKKVISVETESQDSKYLDYDSLLDRLINAIRGSDVNEEE